jgi:anaerobic selenocysteine-containing dehydrogenase
MAEHKVFSACPHDCPDTCAMITTVRDGKAIDVRGNPDHPFTRCGLCVKVNDYQNRVYSPDRVLYPLKRTGRKGACEFQRVSWDAALGEIKTRWRDTSSTGTAQLPSSPTAKLSP